MKLKSSEKSVRLIEADNTLVIEMERRLKKPEIKKILEELLGVKIKRINVNIVDNKKIVYVKLDKKNPAIDVATKFGMI